MLWSSFSVDLPRSVRQNHALQEITSNLTLQTSVHTFNTSSFVTTYFPIPFFAVLFFGYKFWHKSKIINYEDLDFVTGCSIDIPAEVCDLAIIAACSEYCANGTVC